MLVNVSLDDLGAARMLQVTEPVEGGTGSVQIGDNDSAWFPELAGWARNRSDRDNVCGCLVWELDLEPGETEAVDIIVGMIPKDSKRFRDLPDTYRLPAVIDQTEEQTRQWWRDYMSSVEVATPGRYEFVLRRWPESLDAPICSAIDGGRALSIAQAGIQVADFHATASVSEEMRSVTFTADLESGPANIRAWFVTEDNQRLGAYFLAVRRL